MEQKKILFVASVARHIIAFHLPYIQWLKSQGYVVDVACLEDKKLPSYIDNVYDISFVRSPFSIKHFKVYKNLKNVIAKGNYSLVTCHTPMASVLVRLSCLGYRKSGTKVLYTAHGFHFFKGSSFLSWVAYFPLEVFLTRFTDGLVCINREDYYLIKEKGSKKCQYFLIPGIGVESKRFYPIDSKSKSDLRIKNNLNENNLILVYAAEFIDRKNHQFIIDSVIKNREFFTNVTILFAGTGILLEKMKALVKLNELDNIFVFLGFRTDIDIIYKMADIGISSSKQEGMGLNLVEEMMCGLPVIATIDRGHKEVVDNNVNGFLYEQNNIEDFVSKILLLRKNKELYSDFAKNSIIKAKKFEITNSLQETIHIYNKMM